MAQSHPSPMSITQLCNADEDHHRLPAITTIDQNDPDVRLAVEALGDMAKAPSTMANSPLPTPTSSSLSNSRFSFSSDSSINTNHDDELLRPSMPRQQQQQQQPQHFINQLPILNNALRAYENTNGVVKYGVDMVGSFADKFGRRGSSVEPLEEPFEDEAAMAAATALARASLTDNASITNNPGETLRRRRPEDSRDDKMPKKRPTSRPASPHRPYAMAPVSRLPRSRWQQIVMHAGSAAGTTAAVISEESMKCLRYCLSWLQYAIRHIERQMDILRSYLVSLATSNTASSSSADKAVAVPSSSTLSSVKKEIIDTLRKVVEVVSRYAGSGLPEQAKASVRRFILALPGRWATLNTSTTASPASSPALGPSRNHETSIKLLTFGDESIEMLQSVSGVFSDTIERAELWIHRLRVVGVAGGSNSSRISSSSSSAPRGGPAVPQIHQVAVAPPLLRPQPTQEQVEMDTTG